MVHATHHQPRAKADRADFRTALDPSLLRAARDAYLTYFDARPDYPYRPVGVVVNQYTYRGKLVFKAKPVILPQELFVPFEALDGEV